MSAPVFSVLVVCYNHEEYIERALASIGSQDIDFEIEVVVADDRSTDSTVARVQAWAQTVPFPVHVLSDENRLGITLNYYRGLSACRGEFIAVLEGDDEWLSVDKLRLHLEAFRRYPDSPMTANRTLLYENETGEGTVIPLIGVGTMHTRLSVSDLAATNWFATFSSCAYRSAAVQGLPPEIFETIAYDWLLNLAVTATGDAVLLPQVLTLYRTHAGGQWSAVSQFERDEQIRSLLPNYERLVGPDAAAELTRMRHDLERRVQAASLEAKDEVRDTPAADVPAAAEIDRPRPPAVPRVIEAARPAVSVVMASYNHEKWIVEAVNSVLDQTAGDLELIVVDDASTDGTIDAVSVVRDPRLRVYRLGTNQGAAAALNIAIQQARGTYVAVLNSDDAWEPHKLERQLDVMGTRPELGAVFTGARFIGEYGEHLPPERIPRWNDVFRQMNRTQAGWLRYFFEHGNALCHPSLLIRRDFYAEHGLYDNRMRQIPDLERWVTLVKQYPIAVLGDEDLVRFRLLPSEQNASSGTRANVARGLHEHLALDEGFFDGCSDELLVEAFGDAMRDPFFRSPEERACAIAFLWWDLECPMQSLNRLEALRLFRALLADSRTALILRTRYGFTELTYHDYSTHEARVQVDDLTMPDSVAFSPTGQLMAIVLKRVRGAQLRHWPHRLRHHIGMLKRDG